MERSKYFFYHSTIHFCPIGMQLMFIIQCPILWYAKVCALPSARSSYLSLCCRPSSMEACFVPLSESITFPSITHRVHVPRRDGDLALPRDDLRRDQKRRANPSSHSRGIAGRKNVIRRPDKSFGEQRQSHGSILLPCERFQFARSTGTVCAPRRFAGGDVTFFVSIFFGVEIPWTTSTVEKKRMKKKGQTFGTDASAVKPRRWTLLRSPRRVETSEATFHRRHTHTVSDAHIEGGGVVGVCVCVCACVGGGGAPQTRPFAVQTESSNTQELKGTNK